MPKIKVNDVELYYEIHGKGEPVILIPGLAADHNCWATVIDSFARKYQVIAFDNRGVGQSDSPDYPYTLEMMADDAVELQKKLNLSKAHFIGISMGGGIVQQIAYKYPESAKSIISENGAYRYDLKRTDILLEARIKLMEKGIFTEDAFKMIIAPCYSNNFLTQPGIVDTLVQMFRDNPYPQTLVGCKNQQTACLTFDSSNWFNKIQVPALFITSDEDLLVDAKQSEKMAKQIPGAEFYRFEGGVGHIPHIERPDEFCDVAMNFLERITR